jgi:hypothetical protein
MAEQQCLNGKTPWWIVGVLSTILLSAGTAWLHAVQTGEDAVQSLQRNQAERIAVLEHEMGDFRDRLQRIEQKLDRALNRP